MGRTNKASAPRVIGAEPDELAKSRMASEERGFIYNPDGTVKARRRESVFDILVKSGGLTARQRNAAITLQGVYEDMRGLSEPPGWDDLGIRVRSTADPAQIGVIKARKRIEAEARYDRARRLIGPTSADLLELLFYDFLECDHEPPVTDRNGKVIPRWRVKVRSFYRDRGRTLATPNEDNLAVWQACYELQNVQI